MPCSRQYSYIKAMSVYFLGRQPHVAPCAQFSTPYLAHSDGIRTSQQLLAIWHPAWPTKRVECQCVLMFSNVAHSGGETRGAVGRGVNKPFKEMTSRMLSAQAVKRWCLGERGVESRVGVGGEGDVVEELAECGVDVDVSFSWGVLFSGQVRGFSFPADVLAP